MTPTDDENAKKLVELALNSTTKQGGRPPNYSFNSTVGYYNKKYALWAKRYIDKIIGTSNDLSIDSRKLGRTQNTIYQRIYFGWQYLCDHMDNETEQTYIKFREACTISKEPPSFVLIKQKTDQNIDDDTSAAEILDPKRILEDDSVEADTLSDESPWWDAFLEYLESTQENEEFKVADRAIIESDLNKVNKMIGGPGGPYIIKQLDEFGVWLKRK